MAYERDLRLAALDQAKALDRIANYLERIVSHLEGPPKQPEPSAAPEPKVVPPKVSEGKFDGKE